MSTQEPTTGKPGDYRLRVKNFGPIIEAEVEMRPLTVFVGPSNSGKSYLAGLLYAMHRNSAWAAGLMKGDLFPRLVSARPKFELPDSVTRAMYSWLTAPEGVPVIPEDSMDELREACERQIARSVGDEVRRAFGVADLNRLRRWSSCGGTEIEWSGKKAATPGSTARLDLRDSSLSASISDLPSISFDDYGDWRHTLETSPKDKDIENLWIDIVATEVILILLENGFSSTLHRAHCLPGDRASLLRHREAVVGNLIRNASTVAPQPAVRENPAFPGIVADFLEEVGWSGSEGVGGDYTDLSVEVEKNLLGGEVEVNRQSGSPVFLYRANTPDSEDIPLSRTSSMVSGLAPVALYLSWNVRSGDVLIIEEPEAHVHPEKQVEIARQLAGMVRAGIRVVITTHSEWMVEQLGNLTQLSNLPKDRRKGIEEAELALDPKEVGVWLFRSNPQQGGTVVEEVTLDTESGLFPVDYGKIARDLYNQGAAIFHRTQALEE